MPRSGTTSLAGTRRCSVPTSDGGRHERVRRKLPDVGEGIAEAEIVEWHVNVGDPVTEDQVMVEVMTDKATVELPSPVTGVVTFVGAEVGDVMQVGSPLVRIETTNSNEQWRNGWWGDTVSDEWHLPSHRRQPGGAIQTPEPAPASAGASSTPSRHRRARTERLHPPCVGGPRTGHRSLLHHRKRPRWASRPGRPRRPAPGRIEQAATPANAR